MQPPYAVASSADKARILRDTGQILEYPGSPLKEYDNFMYTML